jgi:hypothetical protein
VADGWVLGEQAMRELKREIQGLRNAYENLPRRLATFGNRRREAVYSKEAWFYGVTHTDFTKGTDDTVTVAEWAPNSDGVWEETGTTHNDVIDWFLEDGENVPVGTKVRVDKKKTKWVFTVIACGATEDATILATLP